MHELDQAWLKEEWRALVGNHVAQPVSNAEQTEECFLSQMQTLVSVWLLEYLHQSLTMETYFRSLYQNCPWGIGTSVYTVLCSMMYELRPLYAKGPSANKMITCVGTSALSAYVMGDQVVSARPLSISLSNSHVATK